MTSQKRKSSYIRTEEIKAKIRVSIGCRKGIRFNTGRTHFKKGMIPWSKGRTDLPSSWNKGLKLSEEHKKKLILSHLGKKQSPETIKKRIETMKNDPNWGKWLIGRKVSEETRNKISNSNKGRIVSEETRRKIGQSQIGKYISKESREKMSIAQKERHKKELPMDHHNWRGGISFEPYDYKFNLNLKNKIRKRDNQICMNCGIHREKLNKSLDIHHINYDKKFSIEQNLISLCIKCHSMTNFNREYWTKLFQDKLNKLYNYQYDEQGNVIINMEEVK